MQVVINADDYGHDENRTRAIQEAFRLGAVMSTTAMANRPWLERAMREAADQGCLSEVGLHFNITEGAPLSEEMRNCSELVGEARNFSGEFHRRLFSRLYLPFHVRRAIRAEARAQMAKYFDCGEVLRHLDSHHHVHTDFSLTNDLYAVAKELGFKTARLSRNMGNLGGVAKRVYKRLWNKYSCSRLPSQVDFFGAFCDFCSVWRTLPSGARVEIMVHPLFAEGGELSLDGCLLDTRQPMVEEVEFWREMANHGVS